jgi:hypothetical protein
MLGILGDIFNFHFLSSFNINSSKIHIECKLNARRRPIYLQHILNSITLYIFKDLSSFFTRLLKMITKF